jgi:hypothetical protein
MARTVSLLDAGRVTPFFQVLMGHDPCHGGVVEVAHGNIDFRNLHFLQGDQTMMAVGNLDLVLFPTEKFRKSVSAV